MRSARDKRSGVAWAVDFLGEAAVQLIDLPLRERGYVLTPVARVFPRAAGRRTVRLVWRHRSDGTSVVLTARL